MTLKLLWHVATLQVLSFHWNEHLVPFYIVGMLQWLRRAFVSPLSPDFVPDVSCMKGVGLYNI